MTTLPQPLTPADCNLRDFQFMQVDVHRVLTSDTWVLGTGDERAAAITLWMASWHQVPAGSIPKDDRVLAHLSQSGPKWKKIKDHVLRGWIEAEDGRLYHPVVAEKALEAWVSKLAYSLSGSVGNAKRWGVNIETDSVRARAVDAIAMLRSLAPQSETLKKKTVAVIESGSRGDSGGDDKSSGGDASDLSQGDSGGDRKGEGEGDLKAAASALAVVSRLGAVCQLFRRKGINAGPDKFRDCVWIDNPKVTDTLILDALSIAKQRKPNESISVNYVKPIIADLLAKAEAESAPRKKDWI